MGLHMNKAEALLRGKLRNIYSETTIEHIIHPHNIDGISNPDGHAECQSGCGENMKIWLAIRNHTVEDVGFWTDGCAATVACGSVCTDLIKGKSVRRGLAITARDIAEALVDLPDGNLHCAELAVQTAKMALKDCLAMQQQPWKKLYRR